MISSFKDRQEVLRNIAQYLSENTIELTNGNKDDDFVKHVNIISSIYKNVLEIKNKIVDFEEKIAALKKKINALKEKGDSDSLRYLAPLYVEKRNINKLLYKQAKKEYKETRKKLYKPVENFLGHIRKKLKEKRMEVKRKERLMKEKLEQERIEENKKFEILREIYRKDFSFLLNAKFDNFLFNPVKLKRLVDIFKASDNSKNPVVNFDDINRYLFHFRASLEFCAESLQKACADCITSKEQQIDAIFDEKAKPFIENFYKTGSQLFRYIKKLENQLTMSVIRNKQREMRTDRFVADLKNQIIKDFCITKIKLEELTKEKENEKNYIITRAKDSLNYFFCRHQGEVLETARYLAKIENEWKKEFKDDVTSNFVKYIAKCYRDITKLGDKYVSADLNNAFSDDKESLRLKIQEAEDSLFYLVTYFYVLICSKDKGVDPSKLCGDIFCTRTISNYEFTDVE